MGEEVLRGEADGRDDDDDFIAFDEDCLVECDLDLGRPDFRGGISMNVFAEPTVEVL